MVTLQTTLDNSPDFPVPIEYGVDVSPFYGSDDLDGETCCISALGVSKLSDIPTGSLSQVVSKPSKNLRIIRTGTGFSYPECTTFKFTIAHAVDLGCERKPIHVRCSCHRLSCPECFRSEAAAQARHIDNRLNGLAEAYEDDGVHPGKVKHVVVSRSYILPESSKDDKRAVRKYIKQCTDVLKSSAQDNWSGGVSFFHGWRHKGLNRETNEWEEIQFDGCLDKYIRTKWVWSPHVHFLAFGFFQNGKVVNERTGFLLKRIKDSEGKDRNVRETAFYLLTHSAIWLDSTGAQSGQAYSYFGKFSTNAGGRFKLDKIAEEQYCPDCDMPLVKWSPEPTGPGDPVMEYHHGHCTVTHNYLDEWKDHEHTGTTEPYIITRTIYEYRLSGRVKGHRQQENDDPDQDNVRVLGGD